MPRKRRAKRREIKKEKTLIDFVDSPQELDELVYNIPKGHYLTISPDRKRLLFRKGKVIWKLNSKYPSSVQVVNELE